MFRLGFLLVVSFVLAAHSGQSAALEITNFKAGLICEYKAELDDVELPITWVCFETETIYLTGQGDCVYDGRDEKCTWYGFEFDYSDAKENEEISCVSQSTLPNNEGGPEGVRSRNITYNEWTIDLKPGDGHHFHPQYTVLNFSRYVGTIDSDETVCSVGDYEVFRFRFTKIFPALTDDRLKKALRRLLD